ncbi:uncharacterized protein LOC114956352 [Acropora millepora]|uniref:uncharacterized protein LOC114956352 n=1 Tax=Acropora millepora TaxID=45264 RepID=UPI0010FCCA75|nr:uncharacterized protein LOC114956352 [Acropora millepora]
MSLVRYAKIISSLNTRLPCYSLLVKFEGLNATVLDNFSLFVINSAKARNLQLRKRINLRPTDFKDNQILSHPIDSYEKHRATFQLNKTGRISLFFRYNLTSEYFKEEPSKPPSQYKKISKTYHFNKKGQIIKVAKIPFDETHLFIQNLWDNIPSGVSLHMELVKDEYLP